MSETEDEIQEEGLYEHYSFTADPGQEQMRVDKWLMHKIWFVCVIDDFNFEAEKAQLKQEFGDKIKMIPIDASTTKMWADVIGQTIEAFELSREDEQFLNDALIINFGSEKRSIGISPNDGLIIDYWEDI